MLKLTKTAADFGKVAVLMGGYAPERDISLESGNAVLEALLKAGVDAYALDLKTPQDLLDLKNHKIDHAFVITHGGSGEDGHLQALLQLQGIRYTGSDVTGCAIAMDKLKSKLLWRGAGLPVPDYLPLASMRDLERIEFDYPLIIKPSSEGSSVGVSKVYHQQDLAAAYHLAAQYGQVFAEQFIKGGEYTVGIIGTEPLPVIQIKIANDFYDFDAKYQSTATQLICPCGLDQALEQKLQQLALDAFLAAGGKGWGRVDMMLDEHNKPYLIEMNAVPGMTTHSLVPTAAKVAGVEFETLVQLILQASDA